MSTESIPYVGLLNQGSTCYLSSVIQALFHLPYFRAQIYALREGGHTTPLLTALRRIFAQLELGAPNITTNELTAAFGWNNADALVQHDVHELIQQLFDCLENVVKGGPKEAFIKDIFSGHMTYQTNVVDGVAFRSDRLEGFYDVELVVKDTNNMRESFEKLRTPEKIDGVSLEIEKGKASVHTVERSQHFIELPPVMLIHPNRVDFDMNTYELVTLANRWEFDLEMDLTQFVMDPKQLKFDPESAAKRKELDQHNSPLSTKGSTYVLHSVLIHAGSAHSGHYYCFVHLQGKWYRFNDEVVDVVTWEEVQRSGFGGQARVYGRPFETERASLLVYIKSEIYERIMATTPAPKEVVAEAHQIVNRRQERMGEYECRYHLGDAAVVDVLDGVPGAEARHVRRVTAKGPTLEDALHEIAREHGVPTERVRRVPNSHGIYQVLPESTPDPLFALLRTFIPPQHLSEVTIVNSRSAFVAQTERVDRLFLWTDNKLSEIRAADVLHWKQDTLNVVMCAANVKPDDVERTLLARSECPTRLILIDGANRALRQVMGEVLVDSVDDYSGLQRVVYEKMLKHRTTQALLGKRNHEHIAFFRPSDLVFLPYSLPLLLPRGASAHVEREARNSVECRNNDLYFTLLPVPMTSIMCPLRVVFNFGWANQPSIYLSSRRMTFGDILREARAQVGASMSKNLLQRLDTHTGAGAPVRLLQVSEDGRLLGMVDDTSADISNVLHTSRSLLVLDPVSPCPSILTPMEVCFYSRSTSEFYGLPTSISVAADFSDIGDVVLKRIAKKLNFPEEAEKQLSKWIVSLRDENTQRIITVGRKDTLAKVVKDLGGTHPPTPGRYNFSIDRPKYIELDSTAEEYRESSIVIKTASDSALQLM